MNIQNKKNKGNVLHNQTVAGYIFALPFIIGFLGFTIIPMVISFYYSFTDFNLINEESIVGLSNYLRLFTDERFLKSVRVTLIYVAWSVPLKLVFALFVAYLLTKDSKAVGAYRAVYYLPSLIGGSIAVSLVWKELFARRGLINYIIREIIGGNAISWFGDPQLAMVPLVLISVWQFGSSMIIFAAGLKEIPITYYEAAKIDGANAFQVVKNITLPSISPIILYNLVMQTIAAFMSFTQAFVITGGGPNDSTNFYSLYVYKQAFTYYDMGYASAMSWVMLIVIAVVTLVIFKSSKFWVFSESDV